MNDFKEVWAGISKGLSMSKTLSQMICFNQFVGNFLLEQKIEDELDEMIRKNRVFGKKMDQRAGVDLNKGELRQFHFLMDCLEIRVKLKKLGKRFERVINDLEEFTISMVEESGKDEVQLNVTKKWLESPSLKKKRSSCIPNLQNNRISLFATNNGDIKRQFTNIKENGESVNSFEMLNQVKIEEDSRSMLNNFYQEYEGQRTAPTKKMQVIFQTKKVEQITEDLLEIGKNFFDCVNRFSRCRNLSLLNEMNKILWETCALIKKIPRLTPLIRRNLIAVSWRFWSIVENFELSHAQLVETISHQEKEIKFNKIRLVDNLSELVEEQYCKEFWINNRVGQEGKERVYVRNIDIELLLNHNAELKVIGRKVVSSLLRMIGNIQQEMGIFRIKLDFWNQQAMVIWNKENLYDEEEEDIVEGFFREDLKDIFREYTFSQQSNAKKNDSENTEELKKLNSPLIESEQFAYSKNLTNSRNLRENTVFRPQEILSELTFSQVLNLPGGLWFKMQMRDEHELSRVSALVQNYKSELLSKEMPQLLEEGVKFFEFKQDLFKDYLNMLMLEKKIRIKGVWKGKVTPDKDLFWGLSKFQNLLVQNQMFRLFKRVISENNKPLGLLKLLERVQNKQVKECLLNNFKFFEIFSPEEFHRRNVNFRECVQNFHKEAEEKFELLCQVLGRQAQTKKLVEALFNSLIPEQSDTLQSKDRDSKKLKKNKKIENSKQKKVTNKDAENESEETEEIKEHGLIVIVQFDPNKDSLWIGVRDVHTGKCLVKELKDEHITFLSLKKIQLELEQTKYLLKQNIFHSTTEFTRLWEFHQASIKKLQRGARHFLHRIDLIVSAFLKSLEFIHLKKMGVIRTTKGTYLQNPPDSENQSGQPKKSFMENNLSRDMIDDPNRSFASNTIKNTKSEITEEERIEQFDPIAFRQKLRKNLFLFWDFEFIDINLKNLNTLDEFETVYRDLSFEMFLRRFKSQEAKDNLEAFTELNNDLERLKIQIQNSGGVVAKEKSKSEDVDQKQLLKKRICEVFKTHELEKYSITNGYFLSFNGKANQNTMEYVETENLGDQLNDGIISINLAQKLKNSFAGLDSSTEVIETYNLKKALKKNDFLTIHSVEPSLSIIPWETLLNFFLSDKFVLSSETEQKNDIKYISDHPLSLHGESSDDESRRCPVLFISDRMPFSRKSFHKYPPFEKKFLLFNNMNYAKDAMFLYSFLGAPSVVLGKTNLPMEIHAKLIDSFSGAIDDVFSTFQDSVCKDKQFLDHFFCFGVSLKPFIMM